jgi:hypothetical protein
MIPPAERERQQRLEEARREQKERKAQRAEQPPQRAAQATERPPRPPRPRGQRHERPERPARQPEPRVYVSKPKAPPAKISKEMREGKEPLRTFGDLMQFLEKKNDGEAPAAS